MRSEEMTEKRRKHFNNCIVSRQTQKFAPAHVVGIFLGFCGKKRAAEDSTFYCRLKLAMYLLSPHLTSPHLDSPVLWWALGTSLMACSDSFPLSGLASPRGDNLQWANESARVVPVDGGAACWHSTGRSEGPTFSVRLRAPTGASYHHWYNDSIIRWATCTFLWVLHQRAENCCPVINKVSQNNLCARQEKKNSPTCLICRSTFIHIDTSVKVWSNYHRLLLYYVFPTDVITLMNAASTSVEVTNVTQAVVRRTLQKRSQCLDKFGMEICMQVFRMCVHCFGRLSIYFVPPLNLSKTQQEL